MPSVQGVPGGSAGGGAFAHHVHARFYAAVRAPQVVAVFTIKFFWARKEHGAGTQTQELKLLELGPAKSFKLFGQGHARAGKGPYKVIFIRSLKELIVTFARAFTF